MKLLLTLIFGLTLLLAGCLPPPKNKNPPPAPTPTPTPVTAVKITQPVEGGKVELKEVARGTSQNIPAGQVIWMVIFDQDMNRFFPQNNPADIQANDGWSSAVAIGNPKDGGKKFDLKAVLADKEGQKAFKEYLVNWKGKANAPGLELIPDGAKIYDSVSVIRK